MIAKTKNLNHLNKIVLLMLIFSCYEESSEYENVGEMSKNITDEKIPCSNLNQGDCTNRDDCAEVKGYMISNEGNCAEYIFAYCLEGDSYVTNGQTFIVQNSSGICWSIPYTNLVDGWTIGCSYAEDESSFEICR